MMQIDGQLLDCLPVAGLVHNRDLIYFDGPLLSLFTHERGDDYLYYWCDGDREYNRWMVLRVSRSDVLRLVYRLVPLDFVVPNACRDDFVYFVDMPDSGAHRVTLCSVGAIPSLYKPKPGVLLDARMQEEGRYSVLIDGSWTAEDLADFPHAFGKAYSFLYLLNVRQAHTLGDFQWRGGWTVKHFIDWATSLVPAEHLPAVQAMQYASPGFITFSLHSDTAFQVSKSMRDFRENGKSLRRAYKSLEAYIAVNNLNERGEEKGKIDWTKHNDVISQMTLALVRNFTTIDAGMFSRLSKKPFETAKAAMMFFRFVKNLVDYERRRLAAFPHPVDWPADF